MQKIDKKTEDAGSRSFAIPVTNRSDTTRGVLSVCDDCGQTFTILVKKCLR